jgi:Fic family protein
MNLLRFAKDADQAKQLSRLYRQKKIRRVYRGVYTDDLQTPIARIVQRHWMSLVSHIVPNGILSFRTAVDLKPAPFGEGGIVFVTSSYVKTITLPGLIIKVLKGNRDAYIEQVLPGIARSNRARMLLENLMTVRGRQYKDIKTVGVEGVETILAKELRLRNEDALNQLRDAAKVIAAELGYFSEYEKLSQIISALLSTHPEIAKKEPYDGRRVSLFEDLAVYLKNCRFINRAYQYKKTSFKNLSFFESYFSNFIEGTEFVIDEAEDIVFKGEEIHGRHADSHDVLSSFTLSNDYVEMNITPDSSSELLTLLQNRHAYMMKERQDKRPGQFKTKLNKAGNTYFVEPDEVVGTLCRGFDIYHLLNDGLEKALFIQFLISEVHPFDDGNGRLSRIMMNAELVNAGLFKIIIPSVYRDNYLNGLRLATRDNNFHIYCKAMDQAQAYTAAVDWLDYGEARSKIEGDGANLTADEGLPVFNRALRGLLLSGLG